jgi:tetratricopeptide (TPR) repeat protein
VDIDPGYRQAAARICELRQKGLLGKDDRGFLFTPDLAHYFAWFCPEEQAFFDFRLGIFQGAARSYLDVRHGLRGPVGRDIGDLGGSSAPDESAWQKLFRDGRYRINHVVVSHLDRDGQRAFQRMLPNWHQWSLVYTDGRTSILAWKDPQGRGESELFRTGRIDLEARAFGPEAERAPAEGPGRAPVRRDLSSQFLMTPAPQPLATSQAMFYREYFQNMTGRWQLTFLGFERLLTWHSAVAAAGVAPGSVTAVANLPWMTASPSLPFLNLHGSGPPASVLLTIRAARRALLENPDDAQAYRELAVGYGVLWQALEERWTVGRAPRVAMLRRIQQLAALQQALLLNPDAEEVHRALKTVYLALGYYDMALEHLNEEIEQTQRNGPVRTLEQIETLEEFRKRLEELEKVRKEVDSQVQRVRNDYELRAAREPLGVKAQLAMQRGLAKRALEVLRQADSAQMTAEEFSILVHLLLTTGQVDELLQGFGPNFKTMLGMEYDWFNVLLAAAAGNYNQAGKYLDEIIATLEKEAATFTLLQVQSQTFLGALRPQGLYALTTGAGDRVRNLATYRTLRGLLALEEGDTTTAARFFRLALQTGGEKSAAASEPFEFDGHQIALRYASLLRDAGTK